MQNGGSYSVTCSVQHMSQNKWVGHSAVQQVHMFDTTAWACTRYCTHATSFHHHTQLGLGILPVAYSSDGGFIVENHVTHIENYSDPSALLNTISEPAQAHCFHQ